MLPGPPQAIGTVKDKSHTPDATVRRLPELKRLITEQTCKCVLTFVPFCYWNESRVEATSHR